MPIEEKTLKNLELTKLIGRRLREAVDKGDGNSLPAAIKEGLVAIRRAEARGAANHPIVDIDEGQCDPSPDADSSDGSDRRR